MVEYGTNMEAPFIKEESPMLNRDCGYELAPIYSYLVSPYVSRLCGTNSFISPVEGPEIGSKAWPLQALTSWSKWKKFNFKYGTIFI